MIEVFRTNVTGSADVELLTEVLSGHYPTARITIDLDDHDRVLRIEGDSISKNNVISVLNCIGYQCHVLE